MRFSNKIFKKILAVFVLISTVLLSACGSSDSAKDGIYAQKEDKSANNKYERYFSQQGEQLNRVLSTMDEGAQTDEVFTDPDAYYSENNQRNNNQYQEEDYVYKENYVSGNTSWGLNPSTVNINYYGSPYYYGSSFYGYPYYPYYNYYSPWYYGPRYGYYSPWGWGSYYGYGGWSFGFGFGLGFGYGYGYYPYG
ncbi:MAG TPA: hypothetical protein VK021_05165, partial [Flavobacteriaceae bacterium]|nr:hypothetical protein [Flavobacteriaceae bacterium]